MESVANAIGVAVLGFGVIVVIALLMGLPVMLLWNWLVPPIFGLTTITFWQAIGLNLLSGILIKSHSSSSSK